MKRINRFSYIWMHNANSQNIMLWLNYVFPGPEASSDITISRKLQNSNGTFEELRLIIPFSPTEIRNKLHSTSTLLHQGQPATTRHYIQSPLICIWTQSVDTQFQRLIHLDKRLRESFYNFHIGFRLTSLPFYCLHSDIRLKSHLKRKFSNVDHSVEHFWPVKLFSSSPVKHIPFSYSFFSWYSRFN